MTKRRVGGIIFIEREVNKMNKRGFKMNPEELEAWMTIRKKCHTHDNENKKAYTRKQKHKKEWA